MKKQLFYLFQLLFAITLFLGYSVTVNAATYDTNYNWEIRYYDNRGSSAVAVGSTWNESLQSYISNNITTASGSYGAGVAFSSPIPLIENHTYTLSLYFPDRNNIALSSKSVLLLGSSLDDSKNKYVNEIWTAETIQSKVLNNSIIQFVFKANYSLNYIFLPWTTTNNSTQNYFFTQVIMEDLGSEGVSINDINSSLSNQTNVLNNSIQNSTNEIKGEINDMEQSIVDSNKETQEVIKDQFNDCRDSINLWKNITWSEGTYSYFKLPKENTPYTLAIKRKNNNTITPDLYFGFTQYGYYNPPHITYWLFDGQILRGSTKDGFYYINNYSNGIYLNYISVFPIGHINNINDFFEIQLQEGTSFTTYENPNEEICTNKLNQAEETRKGIWETLKSIPGLILDGIKGLFVPSQEELQSLIDEFKSTMENKLGAIYQVSDMLIDIFRSIFNPTERNSCITFPEIKDPMFDKLLIEQTNYCFDSLRTDFSFLFTISDMIISIVCTLSFGNMLYKKYEGFIGGDTSDY